MKHNALDCLVGLSHTNFVKVSILPDDCIFVVIYRPPIFIQMSASDCVYFPRDKFDILLISNLSLLCALSGMWCKSGVKHQFLR